MPFSSLIFVLLFLPAVVIVYYCFSFSRGLQNIWLLVASLLYYAMGQTYYLVVLLGSALCSWLLGLAIGASKTSGGRRWWLGLSAVLQFGLLLLLRNLPLLLQASAGLTGMAWDTANYTVPIGLSFFSLQAYGYTREVHSGEVRAERNPLRVLLYVCFFPKLLAGPILSYADMAQQMDTRTHSLKKIGHGMARVLTGLGKKVLLGAPFTLLANLVFAQSAMGRHVVSVPVSMAWLGLLAFGLQMYFELSGFCDMAVGMGQIFGFELPENFNYPYAAASLTDFWRRFNRTLNGWFRQNVTLPLNKRANTSQDAVLRNLFITWLLIGLWYGTSLSCVFFGAWFFLLLAGEHFIRVSQRSIPGVVRHAYTIFGVAMGWVLLRAGSLYQAGQFLMNLFGLNYNRFWGSISTVLLRENALLLLLGIALAYPIVPRLSAWAAARTPRVAAVAKGIVYPFVLIGLLLLVVVFLYQGTYRVFTYL